MSFATQLAAVDRLARKSLGETVTYTPGVGAAVPVAGIYDEAYQRADAGESGVATSGPAVFLTLADLPSDPETDAAARVTIRGTVYAVAVPEKDGQGGVLLRLHEAV